MTTDTTPRPGPGRVIRDGAAGLVGILDSVQAARAGADRFETEIAIGALAWCQAHPAGSITMGVDVVPGGDAPVFLAGPGAPAIAGFCVAEFASALRMSTESGRKLFGDVIELAYRLPRLWHSVIAGGTPFWRARQVPVFTRGLSEEAAAWVDRNLAVARFRNLGPRAVENLTNEAKARLDPATAELDRQSAAEQRRVDIHLDQVGIDGLCAVSAVLDAPDALDLDRALNTIATDLGRLGCTSSHDVRRAQALGELARSQPTLPIGNDAALTPAHPSPSHGSGAAFRATPNTTTTGTGAGAGAGAGTGVGAGVGVGGEVEERPTVWSGVPADRRVVLYVHLTERALLEGGVGRCENTRSPVLTETVRSWCGPGARVSVRPVLDLDEPASIDRYEIPDRITEQVTLRDETCVFPYCQRPARGCDTDHTTPYSAGGPTDTGNLASLCRYHHRLKTHDAWVYTAIGASTYLWRSPHGLTFLRDTRGTQPIDPRNASADPDPNEETSTGPSTCAGTGVDQGACAGTGVGPNVDASARSPGASARSPGANTRSPGANRIGPPFTPTRRTENLPFFTLEPRVIPRGSAPDPWATTSKRTPQPHTETGDETRSNDPPF